MAWSTLSKRTRQVPAHFPGDRMDGKIAGEASIAFSQQPLKIQTLSLYETHLCNIMYLELN